MAKKIFSKSELFKLYENRNYKKVISKIKQFKIDGMSEQEVEDITLKSYLSLIESEFKEGDFQRAIRNVDAVLKIKNSDKHKLMKVKYLCYLEHFDRAIEFAKPLLKSRYKTIKQNASFLYSLAKIYTGNFEIEQSIFDTLELDKKNYLLGFIELKKGNINEALEWFEKINPKKEIERSNLEIFKKIILYEDFESISIDKNLYIALILGDTSKLPNTKNARFAKKEIERDSAETNKQKRVKRFFANKEFIQTNEIKKLVTDKDEYRKAIYNNIALICEKKDYVSASSVFFKYKDELVQLPESINLLFKIIKYQPYIELSNVFTMTDNYLQLHHKKLPKFQQLNILDEIFILSVGRRGDNSQKFEKLVKKYNIAPITYLLSFFATSLNLDLKSHIDILKEFFKKKDFLSSKKFIDFFDKFKTEFEDIFEPLSDTERTKKLSMIIKSIDETKGDYKKFQEEIWILLTAISYILLQYDFKKNRENYLLLEKIIKFYKNSFHLSLKELPKECKNISIAIKNKKSMPQKKVKDDSMFGMFENLLNDMGIDKDELADRVFGEEQYDFNDENEDGEDDYYGSFEDLELELEEFCDDFYKASKDEYDDLLEKFANIHSNYKYPAYKELAYKIALDILNYYYINGHKLSFEFIMEFFDKVKLSIFNKDLRDFIPNVLDYEIDNDTKIIFIKYVMDYNSSRENAFYLKWIYSYIKFCRTHSIQIDKIYYNRFIKVYEKKWFTTLKPQYLELLELKDKI